MKQLPRLYGIADASFGEPVEIASRLFSGGVRLVQLRNKQASSGVLLEQAAAIVASAPESGLVILNDRPDIARIAGAAGVHLGQEDLPPSAARKICPRPTLIGLSTHTIDEAVRSLSEPIDYVAVGPIFPTATKKHPSPPVGLEGLTRVCERIHLPVVAIGGIGLENVSDVLEAGASSVAVISDLIGRSDIEGRTRQFLERLGAS